MASPKSKKRPGFFISFEGGEGAGKTTQIGRLVGWLTENRLSARTTRQPGGTPIGEKIREILLSPDHLKLCSRAELLLYEADRAQHADESLLPELEKGAILISDRFADSSTVYQGICRGLGLEWVDRLNRFATGGLVPDLTILLDLPEEEARQRIRRRTQLDRIELENRDFHRQVRRGFLRIAKKNPRRFLVIDASRSEEAIAQEIRQAVEARLKKRRLWKGE